ncbi:DNA replication and repair protein RecF [Candidatus Methylomirabilis lanthanidiphila]|uniref:DNA replication and repair protein RecF n=1 Tax=Candidatus Methylomirabilis lanthanidiphila TaxID=2211376 RepID=A0A564ZLT9_9BACT|nr:AAA family ATPase [Candidatus Methylomirabilis lanthanidiphila]VUZ86294.1 DNA replication and repair protein RecF [Candidatus Methylomirabilis lanthanidiphila]
MKIARTIIENFRGHKRTELEFADHHVLVGENGSGKTAVLEAINYATSSYYLSSRLDEQDFNNADAEAIKITVEFDKPFAVKCPDGYTHQNLLSKSVQLYAKRRDKAAPGKTFSDPFVVSHICIPITFQKKSDIAELVLPDGVTMNDLPTSVVETQEGFAVQRKTGKVMNLRRDTLSLTNDLAGFPNVFYFDRQRERETKTGFNSLLSKIAKDLNWRYRKGWSQKDATEKWGTYYDTVISIVEDPKKSKILSPLKKQLGEFLGKDFDSLEISLLNIEKPFAKGFLSFRDGSNQVDLEGAGSGISMIVALMLLEQVSERAGDDLILLIDEPELHLHPQLQLKLADHLCGTTAQTIVTTHSPLFVDLGDWKSISRMTWTDHYPKKEKLAENLGPKTIAEHLNDIPEFRYHQTAFTSNDSEIFFARKVLLVEGPVEKYGLPKLANALGQHFEQLSIISCDGKDTICHYATICHAFAIPAFVLFDLDGKSETETENARVLAASAGFPVQSFETSFEDLLGVNSDTKHKATKALKRIDEMQTKNAIPNEIQTVIAAIAQWSGGKQP